METIADDTPVRRSDGEQTHAAILRQAVALASVDGLGGLTIGRLAKTLGLSKSGVYAHFRSKRRLQMEVVEAARRVFVAEVIESGLAVPEGLARLRGLCDAFLGYVRRGVFPGGCFFAGMLSEFDAKPGPLHREVEADQHEWLELLRGTAERAQARRELDRGADLDQLAFELHAALELANYLYVLQGDDGVLERARTAVDAAIGRALPVEGS